MCPSAVPRDQLSVPVSPNPAADNDGIQFEAPANAAQKLVLPRYRVEQWSPAGDQQYRIALEGTGQGGRLTVYLRKFSPLAEVTPPAAELPHSVSVTLLYTPPNSGTQTRLPFQQVVADGTDANLLVALITTSLDDLKTVYQALSDDDDDYHASLEVNRRFTVAVQHNPPAAGEVERLNASNAQLNADLQAQQSAMSQLDARVSQLQGNNAQLETDIAALQSDAGQLDAQVQSLQQQAAQLTQQKSELEDRLVQLQDIQDTGDTSELGGPLKPHKANPVAIAALRKSINELDQQINAIDQKTTSLRLQTAQKVARIRDDNTSKASNDATTGQALVDKEVAVRLLQADQENLTANRTRLDEIDHPLYDVIECDLPYRADPQRFVFPPGLFSYIYARVSPQTGLRRQVVDGTNYYQDAARPQWFYFLPDRFRLARAGAPVRHPALHVRFSGGASGSSDMRATLEYTAVAFTDPARLAAARRQLQALLPVDPASVTLAPLGAEPGKLRLQLRLPTAEGTGEELQERSAAILDLSTGIQDAMTLSIDAFRGVYSALFSNSILFQGSVAVELGQGMAEQVPFVARADDLEGELFDYSASSGATSGELQVMLTNRIESALRIQAMSATLSRNGTTVDAAVQGLNPPVQLRSGDALTLSLVPAAPLPGDGPPTFKFDLSGVQVQPDAEAIYASIVDLSTAVYLRVITVRAPAAFFKASVGNTGLTLAEVDVELRRDGASGVTAQLTQAKVDGAFAQTGVQLPSPIADFVLGHADEGQFRYRATAFYTDGSEHIGPWQTSDLDIVTIQTADITA